jgi:hypothetical protein
MHVGLAVWVMKKSAFCNVAKEVILYLGLHIYNGWRLAKYIFMDLSLVTGWLCIWGACGFHQYIF